MGDIVEGRAVGEFPPLIAVLVLGLNCQHGRHLAVARDEYFPGGSGKVGFSMIKPCSSSHQSAASNFIAAAVSRGEDRAPRPDVGDKSRPASGQKPRGLESKGTSSSVICWLLESAGGALAAAARPRGCDTGPLLLPLPDTGWSWGPGPALLTAK